MTPDLLTSIRELDYRLSHGVQVRLLWSSATGRLWVAVIDTQSGSRLRIEVRDDERPRDVFLHPFAYAAEHGVAPEAWPDAHGSLRAAA